MTTKYNNSNKHNNKTNNKCLSVKLDVESKAAGEEREEY